MRRRGEEAERRLASLYLMIRAVKALKPPTIAKRVDKWSRSSAKERGIFNDFKQLEHVARSNNVKHTRNAGYVDVVYE